MLETKIYANESTVMHMQIIDMVCMITGCGHKQVHITHFEHTENALLLLVEDLNTIVPTITDI